MSEKVIVNGNLKELHSSGFEMRDGEPDIRGWKVKNDQNQVIGKVDELLFDTDSLRVRYLILDLEGKPLNLVSRDVIIPIGLAELDKADNIVLLPEVTVGHLATLPEYKKGHVTIATEREVRHVFAPSEGVEYEDPDYYDPHEFYNNRYFDDQRMYRSRVPDIDETNDDVETPETEDRTRIIRTDEKKNFRVDEKEADGVDSDIETSDDDIAVDHEENQITGEDIVDKNRHKENFAPFKNGVMEFTEHAEVPGVSKEPRVIEEISINKKVEEHSEHVKDAVRRNEVEVEKFKKDELED
jgi:stress response protein YsnF